ncbi:polar amino acid transport system substrate-binding protein [Dehalogenimonas formicexedens]|uniref:Polar amino acid transport system substrate-binding protein n=1 Tax=Dehalogenimonas formicexedens TaxID=1839801 RepID=A0A1P8F8G9_9CHLR|nr:basic amino acid ABC transporter substrate-binding protein [Dehalogenimonas formicexedens]APV44723.1 polar amino acid transport system substrate-binding protein [Dehalogenimonas formicexedens]
MKKFTWLAIAVVAMLALALPGCSNGGTSNTTSAGPLKIRVATDATWAPFEYVNETTKKIEGFDIDLLNAIAAKVNLEIEYVNVGFDPLLAGMAQGTYDAAISSITITPERAAQMMFSDPYFTAGQMITVKLNNTTITGQASLSGKKIGAQLGTTGEVLAQDIPNATVRSYDEIGLAFQDLLNGQIDAVICDTPIANNYVKKNSTALKTVGSALSTEDYGIAVAKGKTDLLNKINQGLSQIKSDGTIDQLVTKWLAG